jgi:hypothetical protein
VRKTSIRQAIGRFARGRLIFPSAQGGIYAGVDSIRWHVKDPFVPYDAEQIPGAAMQHSAGVALAQMIFDRRRQIGIDVAIHEI